MHLHTDIDSIYHLPFGQRPSWSICSRECERKRACRFSRRKRTCRDLIWSATLLLAVNNKVSTDNKKRPSRTFNESAAFMTWNILAPPVNIDEVVVDRRGLVVRKLQWLSVPSDNLQVIMSTSHKQRCKSNITSISFFKMSLWTDLSVLSCRPSLEHTNCSSCTIRFCAVLISASPILCINRRYAAIDWA